MIEVNWLVEIRSHLSSVQDVVKYKRRLLSKHAPVDSLHVIANLEKASPPLFRLFVFQVK